MPSLIEIGPVVFEEEIFLNFVNVFLLFPNYLPLKKGVTLHLNKLESHSPKDAMCQVWLNLAHWFLRIKFFIFVSVFSLIRNYIPLEKGGALHLNKLESPLPKDASSLVEIGPVQWF